MEKRRAALRLALVTLVAGALVPLAGSAAVATPGCLDETRPVIELIPGVPIPSGDGCDDSTPPETRITASVTPNAAGFIAASSVTFTLAADVTDGDPGPFGFECKGAGLPQPNAWQSCTSPVTVTGLVDSPANAYAFEARAVDLGDSGRGPDDPLVPPTVADTLDLDPSPAQVRWGQDTTVPFVFVTGTSYDEVTPTQPVVTSGSVPIRLNSSERGSTFECTDNGKAIPCSAGRWELEDPRAGRHTFTARTIDPAGNASTWSTPIEFFVPRNLTRQRGWKKVRGSGYVRGDAVTTSRRGARLVLPRAKVGELRLIAPRGRRYGKVRVRVGKRAWHVVNLAGRKSSLEQHVVIDRYSGMRAGKIVIESLSNKRVVLDAVVARPNRFPAASRRAAHPAAHPAARAADTPAR